MKLRKSALVLLACLAISTLAFSQSQAASRSGGPTPDVLLGLGVTHHASNPATHRAVPDAASLGLATARVYRFASADYPGAAASLVFDENTTTVVGDANAFGGFTLKGGLYETLDVPGSSNSSDTLLTGINTSGEIVGVYTSFLGQNGFLDDAGTFTTLTYGGGGTIEPIGINDSGEIVGAYIDTSSVVHGFSTLDSGTSYTIFDPPGSTGTEAAGVNSSGTICGEFTDATSKTHGFLYSGGVFTQIDFPLATTTVAIGINDSNEIAGYFTDSASINHGFIYSAGAFTEIDVVGATDTQLTRIKDKGQITGEYTDSASEQHGLTGH
jgi:probable HAF family extracellular repeat protein